MALENMVVNLADPGGERFAQIGITLDLEDDKTAEKIKTLLPAIRSNVLMLVSQRSSEELLKRDGKEKLADDIVAEVSRRSATRSRPRQAAQGQPRPTRRRRSARRKKKKPAPVPCTACCSPPSSSSERPTRTTAHR